MTTANLIPALTIVEGVPAVSSLDVADHFGKRHAHLVRSIQSLERNSKEFLDAPIFGRVEYTDTKGERRTYFWMTEEGFSLIVMGFTGAKALRWKFAYIRAFKMMREELTGRPDQSALPRLTTGTERKHLATTRAKIMGALGPSTPGYQRFSRTVNKAIGINHIHELTIDRLAGVEALFDMMWLFVESGRLQEVSNRPSALTRLEPTSDAVKDQLEAMAESIYRGNREYEDFLYGIRDDATKIAKALLACVNDGPAPAMERHAMKTLLEELSRTLSDQAHAHMCAGNAMRPTLRSFIHIASVCQHRSPERAKALPGGKRGRKPVRAALTA